jgi:hypothetical protein
MEIAPPIERMAANLNMNDALAVEKSATAMPSRKPVSALRMFVLSLKVYTWLSQSRAAGKASNRHISS